MFQNKTEIGLRRLMMRKNGTKISFLAAFMFGALGGVMTGLMSWQSTLLLGLFVSGLVLFQKMRVRQSQWAASFWLLSIVLGVLIGLYHPDNFQNPVLLKVEQLYEGGAPFEINLNLAKILAGYAILILFLSRAKQEFAPVVRASSKILLVVIFSFTIISLAYFLLHLGFHPKLLKHIFIFSVFNLFAVCIVEEAFMRLLLQEQIKQFLSSSIRSKFFVEAIPLAIVTFIFVATHGVNTYQAMIVFGMAGFFYGLVFSLTRSLWPSIALHFLVNFLHFSLLTYPLH